jgi:hypothetical protein
MPLYTVVCRGGLVTPKGQPNIPQGKTCEMTEKEAASLPPGTVELVATKPEPKKEK